LDTLLGKAALVPLTVLPKSNVAPPTTRKTSYHLVLDVHAFIANPCRQGETAELFFSLYNHAESRFITEEFCLVLNHLGSPSRDSEQRLGRLRTLFADLKKEDLGSSVYLVCRLVRNGAFKMRNDAATDSAPGGSSRWDHGQSFAHGQAYSELYVGSAASLADGATDDSFSITSGFDGHRTATVETFTTASIVDGRPTFRRPLGCAVVALPQLTRLLSETSGAEISIPIYIPKDESAFATLHENIIENRMKDVLVSPRLGSERKCPLMSESRRS
jgi:dedicator of cytokinesis protein 3